MRRMTVMTMAALVAFASASVASGKGSEAVMTADSPDYDFSNALAAATAPKGTSGETKAESVPPGKPKEEPPACPPLTFHSIEGYSGAVITPMAYLCNCEPKDGCPKEIGLPSVGYTFLNLGTKELHVVSFSQTLLQRLEFGYSYMSLDTGSLNDDIRDAGLDMGERQVGLHTFNFRAMLLDENACDMPLPAITAGVHFKFNEDMDAVDRNLGGAFSAIGYDSDFGIDYTLTATKTFPKLCGGRPVLLTGGLRLSRAAQVGLLGFGDDYKATFEGSVACLATDQLCLAYEYRMKNNPYHELPGLVEEEDDWHAFSASYLVDDHLTVTGIYGVFGNVANAEEDSVLGIQLKYEF